MADANPSQDLKDRFKDIRAQYQGLTDKRKELAALEKQCSSNFSQFQTVLLNRQETEKDVSKKAELKSMMAQVNEWSNTFRSSPSFILAMIIGNVSVTLTSKEERLTYKQEYEKFKMFNTSMMMILSIISLVFNEYFLPSALVHCVSVWYYFTVTLRELVLMTNGSRIKWWWLLHHHCSIVIAALFLMWPPGPCYTSFKPQFMLFSFCLSCVMTLQFRYQKAKLYRQVAMGKRHHMAVSQESQISSVFDFSFLILCLCGIYVFQFYNAYTLYVTYFNTAGCGHWQIIVISGMFVTIAMLNSVTLCSVIYAKLKNYFSPKSKDL